jgi:hypothetical protein
MENKIFGHPVPGTGRRRNRFGGYLKEPQTAQELRMACAHPDYVRAKRNFRNLPTAYDDILKSSCSRSWKNNRSKQYRERKSAN